MDNLEKKQYSTTRSITGKPRSNDVMLEQDNNHMPRSTKDNGHKNQGGLRTNKNIKQTPGQHPLITVVTVVFNSVEHIERTIKSVLQQSYDNIEYIIVDGGSTDGTLEIIELYDGKIDYWISEKDSGLYDAMNKAISASRGEWLNFLNSGDLYNDREALSKAMECSSTDTDVIYSDHYLYNDSQGTTKRVVCNAQALYVLHQSMVYRKSLHEQHGPYLAKKGLLISDYLFFNLLDRKRFSKSEHPISNNLEGGVSTDLSHIREKNAVDYLFGNIGLMRMLIITVRELLGRKLQAFLKRFF